MHNTNFFFKRGKLSVVMDGGAGSSGKGKLGAYLCEHADNWSFACNAFMPQAGHWVVNDDGSKYFYQTFNSCAAMADKYDALYIGPGACIELPAFWREIAENNIPLYKIKISPRASILQAIDQDFERGIIDFEGKPLAEVNHALSLTGTTAHGCGANRARRVLRRPEAKYAADTPELREFLCDTSAEIMARLNGGESGLLEIAQGFQLSNMGRFFPNVTSRNCTVMSGLDDMMLPPYYLGSLMINFRTFPIRISSNKYVSETGKHLTWQEKQEIDANGGRYTIIRGNSGDGYEDQDETSWEAITSISGSPTPIMEMTSVTKLPRRVFTFSKQNVRDALQYNATGNDTYLSINFVNYLDHSLTGCRDVTNVHNLQPGLQEWLAKNLGSFASMVKVLGTGPRTKDSILL